MNPATAEDDLEAWRDFNEKLRRYRRMFVMHGSFGEVCAALVGFAAARPAPDVLEGFQRWMGERHPGQSNLVFWWLVVLEAVPEIPTGNPRELTPENEPQAIQRLHDLLDEFLTECSSSEPA